MTITEFLEARIAEDEAAARNATKGPWEVKPGGDQPWITEVGGDYWLARASSDPGYPKDGNAQHIARHDPARVLAECAAKRAVVELHQTRIYTDEEPGFSMVLWDCMCNRQMSEPCPTIAALAAVYADHPDYLKEWA